MTTAQIKCEKELKRLLAKYNVELIHGEVITTGESKYFKGKFLEFTIDISKDSFEVYVEGENHRDEIWLEKWDYENDEEWINDYLRRVELILLKGSIH